MTPSDVVCEAVAGWLDERAPLVVGVCASQGAGKSTLCREAKARFEARGRRVAVLSLDDLYLSHAARAELAARVHPLFATRGVPGTHDVALGARVLDALRAGGTARLPRFDKASDDPLPQSDWPDAAAPDLILFEGWCVGVPAQAASALAAPVNALERDEDADGVWRRAVNDALAGPYAELWARIDRLVFLAAPDFDTVLRKLDAYSSAGARQRAAAGKRGGFGTALVRGAWAFVRTWVLRRGFLDGRAGFMIAVFNAETVYYRFLKLARYNGQSEQRDP